MKINQVDLKFKSMNKRSKTTMIVLHHTGMERSCSVVDIHKSHLNQGWAGIGYHFYIDRSGQIFAGRPENMVGAHASGCNCESIGVCFDGNFETQEMTTGQVISGHDLVSYLMTKYAIPANRVYKHSQVNLTACPGKHFQYDRIVEGDRNGNKIFRFQSAATTDGFKFPKFGCDGLSGPETLRVMQQAVVKRRLFYRYQNLTSIVQQIVGADVDGKCGKQTERLIREWQRNHGLTIDGAFGVQCWSEWFNEV